jgi:hypothetical protein
MNDRGPKSSVKLPEVSQHVAAAGTPQAAAMNACGWWIRYGA